MLRKLAIVAGLTFLAGCATHNAQLYGSVDTSNKTVTVPPGSEGLKGELKQVMVNDDWKLVVYRGPSVSEGNVGETTKIEHYDTFNSRYRLIASSHQIDMCFKNFTPSPWIEYDVSFIDNKSGAEVFTISGRGCEVDAVEEFVNALHGKGDDA